MFHFELFLSALLPYFATFSVDPVRSLSKITALNQFSTGKLWQNEKEMSLHAIFTLEGETFLNNKI